jgi:Kef-type K+ transport system membrane component KefB
MNNLHSAIQLFLQLAVILLACRTMGSVARRLGQPQVVAEMITGVLLGPSFLGYFWPGLQHWLFPWDPSQTQRDTQSYLFPLSQLGLAAYMFIIGTGFRVDVVRRHLTGALAVSSAGMCAPFVLGGILGWILHRYTELFPARTSSGEAAVFLGASMCITAFPMLARILHEKKLSGTMMGTVAIGAGALDDAAAWALLALVLASFEGHWHTALGNIGLGLAYVVLVTALLRPLLARFQRRFLDPASGELSDTGLALSLCLMTLGAFFTDRIGLHAVFGAFLMGTAMPKGAVAGGLARKMEPLTVALLLPLFFTFSGLNTRIALLNAPALWLACAAILVAAVLGKGVACWLAARTAGLTQREALGVGVLMNARGLMELIIINIGLQRGVISEGLFAALVLMAVLTTLMASPLFDYLVEGRTREAHGASPACGDAPPVFSNPSEYENIPKLL